MASHPLKSPTHSALVAALGSVLWDVDPARVSWRRHRDFLVRRVLSRGTWAQIQWLLDAAGDDVVRETIVRTRAKDLTRKQARFWQVILGIDEAEVTAWLDTPMRRLWEGKPS
jgi:hypothetical protein